MFAPVWALWKEYGDFLSKLYDDIRQFVWDKDLGRRYGERVMSVSVKELQIYAVHNRKDVMDSDRRP